MGKEKKEFSLSRKITCDEARQNLFKSSFSFFDVYDSSNEENYGGGSRRKNSIPVDTRFRFNVDTTRISNGIVKYGEMLLGERE